MTNTARNPSAVSVFNFQSSPIRTVLRDGQPWFVASDICKALGYANPSKAVADHLDDDERSHEQLDRSRMGSKAVVINESGLYALVLRSRKPEARKFAKWVTAEVLPAIRKTGSYALPVAASKPAPKALPNGLSIDQRDVIKSLVRSRVLELPHEKQAKAAIMLWSSLKSKFGCSYKEIQPAQFTEAVSLVARAVLEGELMPREAAADTSMLPEAQAREIKDRLNRLGSMFHPFSDQFADVMGVMRCLRGLHPRMGMQEAGYRRVISLEQPR